MVQAPAHTQSGPLRRARNAFTYAKGPFFPFYDFVYHNRPFIFLIMGGFETRPYKFISIFHGHVL
jgi:hypothetical protein